MNARLHSQVKNATTPTPSFIPSQSDVLERRPANQASPAAAFSEARDALHPSVPSRFEHDFSRVQVYMGAPIRIQTKLTVNQPDDKYEREAERTAEAVVRAPVYRSGNSGQVQNVRRNTYSEGMTVAEGEAAQQIKSLRGSGKPLSASTRTFFEPRFGCDFSGVRLHTDPKSNEMARSMDAEAFTLGRDVFFKRGKHPIASARSKKLMAHELVHVVQQGESKRLSSETIQRQMSHESGQSREVSSTGGERGGTGRVQEIGPVSFPRVSTLDGTTERIVRAALDTVTMGLTGTLSSAARLTGASIAIGLEGEGMAVGGAKGGYGIVFFPDGSIGGYGSIGAGLGASVSAEATVDVTVIGGGIEYFGGDLWFVTFGGGMTLGPAGAISFLFEDDPRENPENREVLGVSVDAGIGASLTVVDAYVGYEDTNAAKLLGSPTE